MKRVLFMMGLYLCAMTMLAVAKDQSWEGWISDAKCGAQGANASHAACAKKCIGAGEKPVFVSDKDQKVIAVANPDAVKDHDGVVHRVADQRENSRDYGETDLPAG